MKSSTAKTILRHKSEIARKRRALGNPVLLCYLLFLSACVTSPTGRQQLILVSDQQMDQMGTQAFADLKEKIPISQNTPLNTYVQCVARSLLQTVEGKLRDQPWEVVVFEDNSANAFALPSGKIGVHTGLLSVAKNASQLAAVIGHEIAHVQAKHGNERVSQALIAQGGLEILDDLMTEKRSRHLIIGALGLGTQFGLLYPTVASRKRKQIAWVSC